jgi:thiosulfate/3-mercaptopyruvate sulfurtransferase
MSLHRNVICIFCLASLLVCALSGCTLKPTKVYSTQDIDLQYMSQALNQPIEVTAETIILDARPPFEFAMYHHPQAVNIQWKDFTDSRGPYPGLLRQELDTQVRRLATLGVGPTTPILVVGQGGKGSGEEGRLAWTLFYLGLSKVQVADVDKIGARYTNITPPHKANVRPWEPELRGTTLADRKEVVAVATRKQTGRVHIIDVRSKNEYFSKNTRLEYQYPDLRAVHIEWSEFFNHQGRPNIAIRDQLKAIGIDIRDRVIVISNNGLRSGAVTFALLSMGYRNAANYAGGYSELLGQPQAIR